MSSNCVCACVSVHLSFMVGTGIGHSWNCDFLHFRMRAQLLFHTFTQTRAPPPFPDSRPMLEFSATVVDMFKATLITHIRLFNCRSMRNSELTQKALLHTCFAFDESEHQFAAPPKGCRGLGTGKWDCDLNTLVWWQLMIDIDVVVYYFYKYIVNLLFRETQYVAVLINSNWLTFYAC